MTDKEKAIKWFENIAEECDKLTSGNVAHLKAQIKAEIERLKENTGIGLSEYDMGFENGKMEVCNSLLMFINSLSDKPKVFPLDKEPTSEELDKAAEDYCSSDTKDGAICRACFRDGAKWDREQMMKDDAFLIAIGDAYVEGIEIKGIKDEQGIIRHSMSRQRIEILYRELDNFIADCTIEECEQYKESLIAIKTLLYSRMK